ncbi:MAG: hypothetical protein Q8L04_16880, partial [Ignavibacteria bacterium]|nr:hypothetical protein [Ignavibacteria bacterium]
LHLRASYLPVFILFIKRNRTFLRDIPPANGGQAFTSIFLFVRKSIWCYFLILRSYFFVLQISGSPVAELNGTYLS